ncbi:MAG: hypothetical protein Q8K60_08550, partial [Parachlamydiaceae bacterium]|nr:hypothetical protein [Parachlamydiaceae bacterium]
MNISNNIIVNSETTSFKSLVSKNNQYISLNKDKNELVFSNLSNNNKFDQTENEIINEIFENILKNLTENFLNRPNS